MITIAVAQPRCTSYDVAANAAAHAAAVRAAGARVVAFPELSLTGYHLDAPTPPRDLLEPLVAACGETGTVAFAGAPVEGRHIGVLEVSGAGVRVAYRKVWLGDAEAVRFRPGPGPAVVEVDGVRLGLAVCRDIAVPRHAADAVAAGVDVYVAGTVKHVWEADHQHELVRRIAVDHGVWVALASFAGRTGEGYESTAGRSAVLDPSGAVVAVADGAAGSLARAEVPATAAGGGA
ncbi:nitrilase-related carbon-nitrogen hydrolase [Saccharothrix sp. HUAS TT1]|uniref:nitrilase-related carbon-nitrogen hydrolase n=1 Tax=unclassified Saccharothrix TaxID=2593673 RepID=UPI00345BFE16